MFIKEDVLQAIQTAEELSTSVPHEILRQELSILKKEYKALTAASGVQKEIQELSCEYYTNELQHTIQVIQSVQ